MIYNPEPELPHPEACTVCRIADQPAGLAVHHSDDETMTRGSEPVYPPTPTRLGCGGGCCTTAVS
eukprot:m.7317 g.7317  ORF g.7317 m.7317 type:complete len:65 (+) comp2434_c0_seq1:1431-1625(+)